MDATHSTNYYTRVTEITKADTYHLEKQNKGKKTVKWKKIAKYLLNLVLNLFNM